VPYATVLTDEEIAAALAELPGWERGEGRLVKMFRRRDFRGSLELLALVADAADEQDHHPDVSISWDRIEFSLRTHAAKGVTRRDVELARAIDIVAGESTPQ
jgi:4a-hydroxytetrahydrobiopterin dehydratase